jgi:hypothetical protein
MLQDLSRLEEVELDQGSTDLEFDDLRSVLRATTRLPSLVIEANFSNIYDRVLDEATIAALTDPSALPKEISDERCEKRKKALMPYLGKRLIGVLINLPGVLYTVEIDPSLKKVIHWECIAT